MADRGTYRAVKVVLLDGPDYQELPERARHVFLVLKLSFGPAGIEVHYPEALAFELAAKTGVPVDEVKGCLNVLEAAGWIRRERNVLWIVGQLEHDPHMSADDEKHRASVWKHIAGLPRLPILGAFVLTHDEWFAARDTTTSKGDPKHLDGAPDEVMALADLAPDVPPPSSGSKKAPTGPKEGPSEPLRSTDDRRQRTETEVTTTDAIASDGEPSASEGPIGAVLAPLIREHLWLGKTQPDPAHGMANDLSICKRLLKEESITPADLADCIEIARSALELPDGRPFDMRLFYVEGRRDRLNICKGAVQKRGSTKTAGQALRNLRLQAVS